MITATFLRKLDGFTGDARLFKLSEPVETRGGHKTDHVVVSATDAILTGPETYIFPADLNGKVTYWREMDGSFQGGLSHSEAIANAGWVEQ